MKTSTDKTVIRHGDGDGDGDEVRLGSVRLGTLRFQFQFQLSRFPFLFVILRFLWLLQFMSSYLYIASNFLLLPAAAAVPIRRLLNPAERTSCSTCNTGQQLYKRELADYTTGSGGEGDRATAGPLAHACCALSMHTQLKQHTHFCFPLGMTKQSITATRWQRGSKWPNYTYALLSGHYANWRYFCRFI